MISILRYQKDKFFALPPIPEVLAISYPDFIEYCLEYSVSLGYNLFVTEKPVIVLDCDKCENFSEILLDIGINLNEPFQSPTSFADFVNVYSYLMSQNVDQNIIDQLIEAFNNIDIKIFDAEIEKIDLDINQMQSIKNKIHFYIDLNFVTPKVLANYQKNIDDMVIFLDKYYRIEEALQIYDFLNTIYDIQNVSLNTITPKYEFYRNILNENTPIKNSITDYLKWLIASVGTNPEENIKINLEKEGIRKENEKEINNAKIKYQWYWEELPKLKSLL